MFLTSFGIWCCRSLNFRGLKTVSHTSFGIRRCRSLNLNISYFITHNNHLLQCLHTSTHIMVYSNKALISLFTEEYNELISLSINTIASKSMMKRTIQTIVSAIVGYRYCVITFGYGELARLLANIYCCC